MIPLRKQTTGLHRRRRKRRPPDCKCQRHQRAPAGVTPRRTWSSKTIALGIGGRLISTSLASLGMLEFSACGVSVLGAGEMLPNRPPDMNW